MKSYPGLTALGCFIQTWVFLCSKLVLNQLQFYTVEINIDTSSVNINHLESVQKHAARMCFKSYSRFSSVTSMLANLNLPTLQERRNRAKLQMLYNIIHQLVVIPNNCLTLIPSYLWSGYFNQLNTNIHCFKYSLFPSTIKQ